MMVRETSAMLQQHKVAKGEQTSFKEGRERVTESSFWKMTGKGALK